MTKKELVKKALTHHCYNLERNPYEKWVVEDVAETSYDILKEAGMLKDEIKLPVKKTAKLDKIPDHTCILYPHHYQFSKGVTIDLQKYPELESFCAVKEEVDYSVIPVGSIVECNWKVYYVTAHNGGFMYVCNDLKSRGGRAIDYHNIEKINVIRWGA